MARHNPDVIVDSFKLNSWIVPVDIVALNNLLRAVYAFLNLSGYPRMANGGGIKTVHSFLEIRCWDQWLLTLVARHRNLAPFNRLDNGWAGIVTFDQIGKENVPVRSGRDLKDRVQIKEIVKLMQGSEPLGQHPKSLTNGTFPILGSFN